MSKHENLYKMSEAGVNVPCFYTLTASQLTYIFGQNDEFSSSHLPTLQSSHVSVRSSGNYSTPGRMQTILNVSNNYDSIKSASIEVWESLQTDSLKTYLKSKNIKDFKMSIIIQEMITIDKPTDFSGVLTTINPITQKDEMYGNVVYGCNGDQLMSGKQTPQKLIFDWTNPSMVSLLEEVQRIRNIFDKPQEIEFVVKNGIVYILQTRDFNTVDVKVQLDVDDILKNCILVGQGESATPFDCIGNLTNHKYDCSGKILFTDYTDFEDTDVLKNSLGIITSTGGTLSHAAIIAREFGKPCIVNVKWVVAIASDDVLIMHHKGGIFRRKK